MKKLLFLLSLILVAFISTAQERTVDEMTFNRNPLTGLHYSYWSYDGTTSDYLVPTTQDSIAIPFDTKRNSGYNYDFVITYDTIAGIDTTVTVLIQGRNSLNEDWSTLSTDVSSVISAQITQSISSGKTATVAAYDVQYVEEADTIMEYPIQTITFANKTEKRFIRALCILTGDDSVGTGVKLIKIELKLWE